MMILQNNQAESGKVGVNGASFVAVVIPHLSWRRFLSIFFKGKTSFFSSEVTGSLNRAVRL